ncbi:MAG: STAS domain-containing protein [Fimbriiglobus sp.]|nr:STAS domain-containing protein [Fimbriiglobus sp.]
MTTITVDDDPTRPGYTRLALRGRVAAADAGELHRCALALVAGTAGVSVDCTEAEYLDASALQVILALGREVERSGRRCVVTAGAATECFRLSGLVGLVSG